MFSFDHLNEYSHDESYNESESESSSESSSESESSESESESESESSESESESESNLSDTDEESIEDMLKKIMAIHGDVASEREKKISELPQIKYADILDFYGKDLIPNEECSICMVKFKKNNIIKMLKCEHLFHIECIDTWLKNNNKCPVCREKSV